MSTRGISSLCDYTDMYSACVTSMVRLKYLKDFYPNIDGSCKSLSPSAFLAIMI